MKKILLVGYGKMGKAIEKIAIDRGNNVVGIIDPTQEAKISDFDASTADVAIEFTQPDSAFKNIHDCIMQGIPVVSGTTGWLDRKEEIELYTKEQNCAFFYASNFSIGVNLFFELNKKLGALMNGFQDYDVDMTEIHHIHKKDAPSGTAITLAEGTIDTFEPKRKWALDKSTDNSDLIIEALREGEVPGTHIVRFKSEIDTIEIKHEAHSRQGFATGAVVAAEWLAGKAGVFGMNDLLKI